jgi:TolB-like protein/tetratricopeptide (TPR) repeat protein
VVTDDAITRCISELRTVLGDTDRERSYIRTIPRRGYSLIAPLTLPSQAPAEPETVSRTPPAEVSPVPGSAPVPRGSGPESTRVPGRRWPAMLIGLVTIAFALLGFLGRGAEGPVSAAKPRALPAEAGTVSKVQPGPPAIPGAVHSIAVLPFVNLSGDADHEYFSEGLSEDIRDALLVHTDLRVAARTSSSAFKNKAMDIREIGAQLDVDALLEGTVRISDGRLRVTTALSDARTGYSIWAGSFERDSKDKVQIQTEVAAEIVNRLVPSLGLDPERLRRSAANVQAHDYYLLGRHHWNLRTPESLEQAVQYFRRSLDLDPGYAPSRSGLADALLFQVNYGGKRLDEVEKEARDAIVRALELDPQLAEAHASMGILMSLLGRHDEALAALQRAVDLKPQYSMAQMWLGNEWLERGDVKRAHGHYREALMVDPLHAQVQSNYANVLMNMGRYDEAVESIQRFTRVRPDDALLKMELDARLLQGRYDEVLALAVGHTFTGDYKPYASEIVIETLIQLRRLDEAERMIHDNASAMEPWWQAWLKASVAVVGRDAEGLERAARLWSGPGILRGDPGKEACALAMNSYLLGVAAYIAGNFELANTRFADLERSDFKKSCYLSEPDLELASLIYQASARLHVDGRDARGRELLEEARLRIARMREQGWDTLHLNVLEVAVLFHAGQPAAARAAVQAMIDRGWQPYGLMLSSPLFDGALDTPAPFWEGLAAGFDSMQERCRGISLAKLGL